MNVIFSTKRLPKFRLFPGLLLILLISPSLFPQGKSDIETIAIIPAYDYPANSINSRNYEDMISSVLQKIKKNKAVGILDKKSVENVLTENKINTKKLLFSDDLEGIGKLLNADMIIFCIYYVSENEIRMSINIHKTGGNTVIASRSENLYDIVTSIIEGKNIALSDMGAIEIQKELTAEMEKEKIISPKNITRSKLNKANISGLVLISSSIPIAITGCSLFLIDYFEKDVQNKNQYYNNAGLFSAGISMMALGGILSITSIPLLIYRKKTSIALNINFSPGLTFSITCKL